MDGDDAARGLGRAFEPDARPANWRRHRAPLAEWDGRPPDFPAG
ncbi:hypothetical protein [Pseudonocardia acidicola]|nr:hypothetical protein [Pseudonocardia acidicola]